MSETPTTITAIAPWFGGKRNLAPTIVQELGQHTAYWEIFCGGMAVLLSKPPCSMETVNDLHQELTNLASVIQGQKTGPLFYRWLRRVWMTEDQFNESDKIVRDGEKLPPMDTACLDRAFHYFIASWLGRNGCSGTPASTKGTFCVRYTANGGAPAKRLNSVIETIPAWRRRLRNVTILNRDGFDLLTRIEDAPGTAIYCDGPYLKKGARYLHDDDSRPSCTEDEWRNAVAWARKHHDDSITIERIAWHKLLADRNSRFTKARVVVSYYDHPLLTELYPLARWTHRKIEVSKAMAHQGARGKNETKATEVLLLNGPSYVEGEGLLGGGQ